MKISEIFLSLQGESTFAGIPTVFVRFWGCNLKCTWCDTNYAKEGEPKDMKIGEILDAIQDEVTSFERHNFFVCITGGEPMMQGDELKTLCQAIQAEWGNRAVITIETNGSYTIPWHMPNLFWIVDIKPPSSGHESKWHEITKVMRSLMPQDEIKFVIADENDFYFAKDIIEALIPTQFLDGRAVILSPMMGGENEKLPQDLAAWIIDAGLPVRMQIQMHKVIWPDRKSGV